MVAFFGQNWAKPYIGKLAYSKTNGLTNYWAGWTGSIALSHGFHDTAHFLWHSVMLRGHRVIMHPNTHGASL